jgi:hypothetical protein
VKDLLLVPNQKHSDAVLLSGKKRALDYCLRGMIPPHGVNSDIHDEELKLASDRKGIKRKSIKTTVALYC